MSIFNANFNIGTDALIKFGYKNEYFYKNHKFWCLLEYFHMTEQSQ